MIFRDIAKVLNTTAGYLMDEDEMGFDADVMQLAMMLQELKKEDVKSGDCKFLSSQRLE